jgi:hypothetical protein
MLSERSDIKGNVGTKLGSRNQISITAPTPRRFGTPLETNSDAQMFLQQ